MQFSSFEFLTFFTIVILLYFLMPRRVKYIWLLVSSYVFYCGFGIFCMAFLVGTTVVTYCGGIVIDAINNSEVLEENQKLNRRKAALAVIIGLCIIQLGIFKYSPLNIMMPIGISFYTFAAIGYLADVYKGKIKAQKNIAKYALFVSFFPYIVSGPIERAGHFMDQIEEMGKKRIWNYDKFVRGFVTMMYGYFLKLVLADRICAIADAIYDNYQSYGTIMLCGGAVAYSVQIYADFAGYSLIAIGAARMMGIDIIDNFNTPYLARNIKDFWSRWHMSLSGWLRDYVYIPLGGSRCSKARNYINLMLTFLISGAWHGNGMRFVFWGFLHGAYQVISKATMSERLKFRERIGIRENSKILIAWQTLWTFVMVTIAWIFFRVPTIVDGFGYIGRMVSQFDLSYVLANGIHDIGIDNRDALALAIAFLLLIVVSLYKYNKNESITDVLMRRPAILRIAVILLLVFTVLIFGEYGPGAYSVPFVYAQF